jgi:GTP-binding protein
VDWSGEGDVFTLADVPGLLEGASEGIGLGHEFLAHLERCFLLLHVVDIMGSDGVEPLAGFRTILAELEAHAAGLAEKPQVIVLSKIDALPAEEVEEQREVFVAEVEALRQAGHPAFGYTVGEDELQSRQMVWPVSASTGAGLTALVHWVGPLLAGLRAAEPAPVAAADIGVAEEGGHVIYRPAAAGEKTFIVSRTEGGFTVKGEGVRRLVRRFDLDNEEASQYLAEKLDRLGVYAALRTQGAQPGDEVDIEGYTFEFH